MSEEQLTNIFGDYEPHVVDEEKGVESRKGGTELSRWTMMRRGKIWGNVR